MNPEVGIYRNRKKAIQKHSQCKRVEKWGGRGKKGPDPTGCDKEFVSILCEMEIQWSILLSKGMIVSGFRISPATM